MKNNLLKYLVTLTVVGTLLGGLTCAETIKIHGSSAFLTLLLG